MRFLLDASADFRLARYLIDLGHDVTSIAKDHPQSIPDQDVLALALREQRILITNDRDFGELVVRLGLPHAGIVYFRLEETDIQAKIAGMDLVLRDYVDRLSDLLVVTEQGVRVRSVS